MAKIFGAACAVVVASALAVSAPAAKASLITGGSCPGATQAFAQWGDSRYYTFGQNGGLELGSLGWSLSKGASVVSGNESFYVHSRSDSHSLLLQRGATATTPLLCMGTTSTVVRFFAQGGSSVRVDVVERNLLGVVVGVLDWTTISTPESWEPSPTVLNLDSLLGLVGASSIQLRFTALDGPAGIDDVYVDPWSSWN